MNIPFFEFRDILIDFDKSTSVGASGNVISLDRQFSLRFGKIIVPGENSLLCKVDEINSYGLIGVCRIE